MSKRKSELDKAIDAAISATTSATAKVHAAGVMCLNHAKEHGDFMPLARLAFGIPSFMQGRFMFWCRAFSPVTFTKESRIASLNRNDDAKPFDIEKAKAVNPFNLERAKARPEYSAETMTVKLNSLLKSYEKNAPDDTEVKRIVAAIRALEARNFGVTVVTAPKATVRPARRANGRTVALATEALAA
jgi:hypothetical protein